MENGDDIAGIALGHNWVAAVTSPYFYLRLWSVSGLQYLPLQLPITSFVSMVSLGHDFACSLKLVIVVFSLIVADMSN